MCLSLTILVDDNMKNQPNIIEQNLCKSIIPLSSNSKTSKNVNCDRKQFRPCQGTHQMASVGIRVNSAANN